MAITNELVTKFSFLGSLAPQREFNANLSGTLKLMGGVAAGLTAAASGWTAWVNSVLSGLDPLAQLTRRTGLAVEAIQELGYAASVSGSSAAALEAGLIGLNQNIGATAMGIGRFATLAFERLGISVRDAAGEVKTADVVLDEIRQRFGELNIGMAEQTKIATALGLNPDLVQLLRLTDAEMGALRKTARGLGIITGQQADQIADYNDAVETLKFGLKSLQSQIAIAFVPELKGLADRLADWIGRNKELIKQIGVSIGQSLYRLMGVLKKLSPVIIGIGAAWAIAFAPLTTLVIGGLLVIDDLLVAMRGGRSVIREFFQEFIGVDIAPILRDWLGKVKGWVADAKVRFAPLLDSLKEIFQGAIDFLKGDTDKAKEHLETAFRGVWKVLEGLAQDFRGLVVRVIGEEMTAKIESAFKTVMAIVSDLVHLDLASAFEKLRPAIVALADLVISVFRDVVVPAVRGAIMFMLRDLRAADVLDALMPSWITGPTKEAGRVLRDAYRLAGGSRIRESSLGRALSLGPVLPAPDLRPSRTGLGQPPVYTDRNTPPPALNQQNFINVTNNSPKVVQEWLRWQTAGAVVPTGGAPR